MTTVKVIPIDKDRYYYITTFDHSMLDSLEYKRYRPPITTSKIFALKYPYAAPSSGLGAFCVIHYMIKDSLVQSIVVGALNDTSKLVTLGIVNTSTMGDNLIISGSFPGDSIQILGAQQYRVGTNGNGRNFLLCISPTGEPVFFKANKAGIGQYFNILNAESNGAIVFIPGNKPKLEGFNPTLSDSIYQDTLITGTLLKLNANGQLVWYDVGSFPGNENIRSRGTEKGKNRCMIAGSYTTTQTPKNSNNSKIYATNYSIQVPQPFNDYKNLISFIETDTAGKFMSHFWIRGKNIFNSGLTGNELVTYEYYKNGFLFLLKNCDSFEFGRNNQAWGIFKLKINGQHYPLVFIDTIQKTAIVGKCPPGLLWAYSDNDSSVIVHGTYSDPNGQQNLDIRNGERYNIDNGPFLAQYKNYGELVWARNDNYSTFTDVCYVSGKGGKYLFHSVTPRTDMELGFKKLPNLFFSGNSGWLTKLSCKPISDFSYDIVGGCFHGTNLGNLSEKFTWDFGDGSKDQTSRYCRHCYIVNGTYNVKLIVTNTCGSDTAVYPVTITAASVSDFDKKEFRVYPNPANSEIILEIFQDPGEYSYQIYSVFGSIIEKGLTHNNERIQLNDALLPGIYIISVRTKSGFQSSSKLVIRD